MNCIERLSVFTRFCYPCQAKIIEFDDLPEAEKYRFDYYDKEIDYLICCVQCENFMLIPSDVK